MDCYPLSNGLVRGGGRTPADSSRGGTRPRLLQGAAGQCPGQTANPPVCVRLRFGQAGLSAVLLHAALVLDDAALRLLSRSSQPTASSLGAMGPHRHTIALSDWLSHFLLPWTGVLHRPTRKICDPACLVLPKGSPAGVLHASHHAPPLFSGLLGFSSWSQLPLSNWQLVPTGNPIRAEVNGHFISHSTEL
jgi:hypothetical protein